MTVTIIPIIGCLYTFLKLTLYDCEKVFNCDYYPVIDRLQQ